MAQTYKIYNDWGKQYNRLKLLNNLNLPSLASGTELMLVVTTNGDVEARTVPSGGVGNDTASNAGGLGLFKSKTGSNFAFKGLTAGANVTLTPNTNDIAVAVSGLATVANSGSYNDLTGKPTIPAAQVASDWNSVSGASQILNKPTIPAAVNLIEGTNVTITGTYPNKTINVISSGGDTYVNSFEDAFPNT